VIRSSRVRRTLFTLSGLVFVAIALGSLLAPHEMAAGLGYTLGNVDALSEFRAVYVGLWLAIAVLLVVAGSRVQPALVGDLGALLILGQSVGRLLSLALDGPPTSRIWPMFALETLAGIALLLVRPSAPPLTRPLTRPCSPADGPGMAKSPR